jgi:hypothetical protein
MKRILTLITLTAFAIVPATTFAATKKDAAPAATPAPAAKPDAAKPAEAKPAKAIPLYTEVSAIDAATKSFTHKNKDGKEVKFNVTDKTEIKNGDAAAKFEDIKVGDYVSGSRIKKSDSEYDVVKITKFGPKTEKKAAAPTAPAKATPAPKK